MRNSIYKIADSEVGGSEAQVIPNLGAWLFSYKIRNKYGDLVDIFHTDPELLELWPNKIHCGSPILFPQAGPCSLNGKPGLYSYGGRTFSMAQHGFGRCSPWMIVSHEKNFITLQLTHTKESLKNYPFEFLAEIQYSIQQENLNWRISVLNQSDQKMPFSLGFHPYFKIPNGAENFYVNLPPGKQAIPNGSIEEWNLKKNSNPLVPAAKNLSNTYFQTNIEPKNRSAIIEDVYSGMKLELDFKLARDFDTLAIWSAGPTLPYLCVEPWSALPNALNTKNGIIELAPGERWSGRFAIHTVIRPRN